MAVTVDVLKHGVAKGAPRVPGSTMAVDCSAVVNVGRRGVGSGFGEKFAFVGCWEGYQGGPVGRIDKVAAHFSEAVARADWWHEDWRGNDVADELAKDARPDADQCLRP